MTTAISIKSSRTMRAYCVLVALIVSLCSVCVLGLFAQDADALPWRNADATVLTNDKASIYASQTKTGDYNRIKNTYVIKKCSTPYATPKKLFTVKAFDIRLCGYYKNKVYYAVNAAGSEPGTLYCYNLSTKKKKRIVKHGYDFQMQKKYMIGWQNTGAWGPMPLYSVNMAKGKAKTICKTMASTRVVGNKVYFIKASSKMDSQYRFTFKVMKCNFSGTGIKAVSKSFKASSCSFSSDHTVSYYANGRSQTLYF